MTIRLGRRWAHGRRYRRGIPQVAVSEILARVGDQRTVARSLLTRALRATGAAGVLVRPEEADVATMLADAGAVRLEERVEGTVVDHRWVPRRVIIPPDAAAEVAEALGRLVPADERQRLVDEVGAEPFVVTELIALAAEDPEAPLRAPPGSALAGAPWSVYAAAIRAVACWAGAERAGERLSERELAARALGWSKAWTPARRQAFEVLSGRPLAEAVTRTERFLRIAGPLRWRLAGAEGDARAGQPWIGIPDGAIDRLEVVETSASRVLVIENLETFEEAVRAGAGSDSVVVYGGGYVSGGVVALLRRLPLPLHVWADLDPHGVRIAADVSRRAGRQVTPVGMEPALLASPYARAATPEQVADAEAAADTLGDPWSAIAAAIADARRVCEQEALHAELLRSHTV